MRPSQTARRNITGFVVVRFGYMLASPVDLSYEFLGLHKATGRSAG